MQTALDAVGSFQNDGALGTVVYLGAGSGADLGAILDRRPRRLILLEGDADRAAALRRRFAGHGSIDVCTQVVSAKPGRRTWHRFNLGRLNGLLSPEDRLRRAYPRLREVGTATVEAVPLAEWLEQLDIDADEAVDGNLLVFDIAGIEGSMLEGLPARHLDVFPWVLIRGAVVQLHEGGSTLAHARARMAQFGYRVISADPAEALWPAELYHGDPRVRKIARLQRQLAAMKSALESRSAELAESHSQAQVLQDKSDGLASRLQAQEQALQAARQQAGDLSHEVSRLGAELAQLRVEHERLGAAHALDLAAEKGRVEQVSRELALARTKANDAGKLRMLREADLRDLRARYETLQTQYDSRQALLAELARRLGVMSEHAAPSEAEAPTARDVAGSRGQR